MAGNGDLKANCKELEGINDRQEKRVQYLESNVYVLATFYLVFQGVVLTAVSQSSSLKCHRWWIPFTLSLLAALINGFALTNRIVKYVRTKNELDKNRIDLENMKRRIHAGTSTLNQLGKPKVEASKLLQRYLYVAMIVLALIGFTITMLVACHQILCDKYVPVKGA